MLTVPFIPLPAAQGPNWYTDVRLAVNRLLAGKMNCVGSFAIEAGTTSTEVPDRNVGADSFIGFMGLDAGTGDLYVTSRDPVNHKFTVASNASQTPRNIVYAVFG